jgi:inositol transport system substrate-binding protein
MKKIITVLISLVVMVSMLAGCASSSPAPAASSSAAPSASASASAEPQQTKFKVALLPTDVSLTYASWLTQSFEKYAKNYPNIEFTVLDSKNKVETQLSNLENCVQQKYDFIILHPVDVEAIIGKADEVVAGGIPVLIVNQSDGGSKLVSNVDADPVEQGEVPAKVAFERIPQNGKVVVLLGPSGNRHSAGRREGFQKELFDKRPDIQILDEQIGNWNKAEGMRYMEDWLQRFDKIDAVISMNDAMALGTIEAVKAQNKMEGMTFYGVDGLADAVLSIQASELTATCVQNADEQAKQSLIIADKVLKSEEKVVKYLTPGELITLDNVAQWVEVHKENGQIK